MCDIIKCKEYQSERYILGLTQLFQNDLRCDKIKYFDKDYGIKSRSLFELRCILLQADISQAQGPLEALMSY